MADEVGTTPGTETTTGTAATETQGTGKTEAAPKVGDGKPGAGKTVETTGKESTGTQKEAEESFFDPKSLSPELIPAYKEMQRAFSKKTEAISKDRSKIEAYDAFSKDPLGQIQTMASRMGYQLTRAEAAKVASEGKTGSGDWEPTTWGEVIDKITSKTQERLIQQLGPIISEVQTLRKGNIEKLLDDNCPDWRQYEDDMKSNIQAHPSLVNDPVMLYRLSVPPEVLETRATQAAIKKLEDKVKGKHQDLGTGDKAMSFNEAVDYAKKKLASEGLHPPG
jgi:hypothetical protein